MSLCDICLNPGRCCKGFVLSNQEIMDTVDPEEIQVKLDNHIAYMVGDESRAIDFDTKVAFSKEEILEVLAEGGATNVKIGLPFIFMYRKNNMNFFTCKNIDADGRCTDYENRPSICRAFEPGSSPICNIR